MNRYNLVSLVLFLMIVNVLSSELPEPTQSTDTQIETSQLLSRAPQMSEEFNTSKKSLSEDHPMDKKKLKAFTEEAQRKKESFFKKLSQSNTNTNAIIDKISDEEYFDTDPKELTCVQHMKFLKMGFACIDSASLSAEEQLFTKPDDVKSSGYQTIFVVTRNSKKYFMKILDNSYDLELAIMAVMQTENSYGLELIEYKIVNHRFVGIYQYIEHHNTLKHWIKKGTLTYYEKLFIMQKLTKFAMQFYEIIDPKNGLIKLNLLTNNMIFTNESFYSMRFITYGRYLKKEVQPRYQTPESRVKGNRLNQKISAAYILGKMFYLILFNSELETESIDDEPDAVELLNNVHINYPEIDPILVDIIKETNNRNPVDRIALESIHSKLTALERKNNNPYYDFVKYNRYCEFKMKDELRNEYLANEEKIRSDIIRATQKNSQKSNLIVLQYKSMINKPINLRYLYLTFVGRGSTCELAVTNEQINTVDSYGMISNSDNSEAIYAKWKEGSIVNSPDHHHDHDHHDDLSVMKWQFMLLIFIMFMIICICSIYFVLKNLKIKMYKKEDFSAKLVTA